MAPKNRSKLTSDVHGKNQESAALLLLHFRKLPGGFSPPSRVPLDRRSSRTSSWRRRRGRCCFMGATFAAEASGRDCGGRRFRPPSPHMVLVRFRNNRRSTMTRRHDRHVISADTRERKSRWPKIISSTSSFRASMAFSTTRKKLSQSPKSAVVACFEVVGRV